MKTSLAVLYDFLFIISRFKVTSSRLYKGGNKKHFDNLLHVLYQRVRPQKQPEFFKLKLHSCDQQLGDTYSH